MTTAPATTAPSDTREPSDTRPAEKSESAGARRTASGQFRVRSLDGLRGTAALIVVLHHLSMTIPAVSAGYSNPSALVPFSLAWWLVATPVKIIVAGPEFVLVFFVLSGFVLTLAPVASHDRPATRRFDWIAYYLRRVVRIGVPAAASMVIAYAVITLLPRPHAHPVSSWVARQAHPDLSWHKLITQTLLIVNPNRPGVNPPMWSLTWEMWFSLLLPLAFLLVLWWRRAPGLWIPVLLAVSLGGYVLHRDGATFLPAFVLGALLGTQAPRIEAFVDRHRGQRRLAVLGGVLVAFGPLMMICYWLLRTPLSLGHDGTAAALAMRVPGALLLVAVVAFWPPARAFFETRALVMLGMVSFSLYLVHSQVLVTMGLNFTGSRWPLGAAAALPIIAALTFVMYRFVEKPSIALGKGAGRWVSHLLRRAGTRLLSVLPLPADSSRDGPADSGPSVGSDHGQSSDSDSGQAYEADRRTSLPS